jgi:AraC family ethanolamine operon transcriptional activator
VVGDLRAAQITFEGIEGIRRSVQGGDVSAVQLHPPPLPKGAGIHVASESFALSVGHTHGDVRTSGVLHPDRITIGARLGGVGTMVQLRQDALPGDMYVYPAGAEHYGRTTGRVSWGVLSLDANLLVEVAGIDGLIGDRPIWESLGHYRAARGVRAAISSSVVEMTRQIASSDVPLNGRRLVYVQHRIIETFLAGVIYDEGRPEPRVARAGETLLRCVDRWLDERESDPVHVADLCEAFAMPRRTLQRTFRATVGLGPAQYLARRRLSQVRRILVDADPRITNVTDVAMDHGFLELGRFAVSYRKLFGEKPSETLHGPRSWLAASSHL